MDHAICIGITKTIIDGLKDAQMQYDYAVAAKKHGDTTVAKLHLDEATRRLSGVGEWKKRLQDFIDKQSDDTVESILWEYYDDWKEKLHRCISEFKL